MNKVIAIAALSIAGSAYAQLPLPLPPASTGDGVSFQNYNPGPNVGLTRWDSPTGIKAYSYASDGTLEDPNMESPDNRLGLSWSPSPHGHVAGYKASLDVLGGTVRTIFVGESAGWLNDLGYTYSGNPAGPGSWTVASDLQAVNPGANVTFGRYFDVGLDIADNAFTFDVWLNGVGGMGPINPATPTSTGGVYTVFNPTNSSPYIAPGNVLWANAPLVVSTWIGHTADTADGVNDGYTNVLTYLVGIEDWRRNTEGFDGDTNDLMIAFQFFQTNGRPFDAVPEPSTYGLMGAAALMGLVAYRRFKSKK